MNTEPTSHDPASSAGLPPLEERRIDEMESAVFDRIGRERSAGRRRRQTGWMLGGAAAAVIVVAAVIAPGVASLVGKPATYDAAVAPDQPAFAPPEQLDAATRSDSAGGASAESSAEVGADASGRDIITTASATLVVDDVADAAAVIAEAARSRDGYVESMSVDTSAGATAVDPGTGIAYDSSMPYPYPSDGAWITVRVPADALGSLVDQLEGVGEVTSSTVSRQDVTTVTVDLQARVEAAEASVQRLTELMSEATSVADLIAAESALTERQAMLESYQQQLEYYQDQVAMSTLTVSLLPDVEQVTADPAGFGDGLAAGWNGLVATLNAIVIALGFLIPWVLVLALAALIVWGIVRLVRGRRRSRPASGAGPENPAADTQPTA